MKARFANRRNSLTGIAAGVVFAVMVGATFASVPLYTAFCRATGYGGTPKIASQNASERGARTLTVRFDTNIAPGLDWTLEPETPSVQVLAGKTTTVYFRATNRSARETAGNAVYNVTPDVAGAWFDKIACFCFNEEHLGPHETTEWPVVFFLDPGLEKDPTMNGVDTITLSYSLYPAARPEKPVALAPAASSTTPRL